MILLKKSIGNLYKTLEVLSYKKKLSENSLFNRKIIWQYGRIKGRINKSFSIKYFEKTQWYIKRNQVIA